MFLVAQTLDKVRQRHDLVVFLEVAKLALEHLFSQMSAVDVRGAVIMFGRGYPAVSDYGGFASIPVREEPYYLKGPQKEEVDVSETPEH